eukprot:scaffold155460_cov18-Tisochrysis_lutea.AAC.1
MAGVACVEACANVRLQVLQRRSPAAAAAAAAGVEMCIHVAAQYARVLGCPTSALFQQRICMQALAQQVPERWLHQ